MNVTQKKIFMPITIVLETAEEVDAIFTVICAHNPNLKVTNKQQKIINELSDKLCNPATH